MNLSPDQRRYLLLGQCAVPFALNFVINGLIGWGMFRGVAPVPVWGMNSSAGPDTLGTCFFLPAITCLIVTGIVRRHTRRGTVAPLVAPASLPRWLRTFHRPLARRAFVLGATCLAVVGGAVAAVLLASGVSEVPHTPFLWFKAAFSAVLGGAVTPAIGLLALADPIRSEHARPT
ncbi:MAG: hypothetical protein ACE5I7_05200 [Candidatus Binatia bacterium]